MKKSNVKTDMTCMNDYTLLIMEIKSALPLLEK